MEEIAYMVCMRVDELDDPVTDSTTTACVECGDDVWISAASRKQMRVKKAMPVCSRCAKRIAQENDWEPGDAGPPLETGPVHGAARRSSGSRSRCSSTTPTRTCSPGPT